MDDIIADIFGENDEEEEFEGFAENEVDKAAHKDDDDDDDEDDLEIGKKPSATTDDQKDGGEDSDTSDEGVVDAVVDDRGLSDFDAMMARKKATNKKFRKRGRGDIDIINDSDDMIADLISRMKMAAEDDRELVTLHQPATKKLKMLPEVVNLLKKADLRMALVDCGMLRAITEWLAPLPDKSLPCLPIREAMLHGLQEFPSLHTEILKDSGVGKAVMFLLKHPRENRKNKENASRLINEWSRPIFNLSTNYKGLSKEEREERDYANLPKKRNIESEAAQKRDISKEMESEKKGSVRPGEPGWIGRARVPQPSFKDYVVRPKSTVETGAVHRKSAKKEVSRFEKHMRNIKSTNDMNKKNLRAVEMSLEGRKMAL